MESEPQIHFQLDADADANANANASANASANADADPPPHATKLPEPLEADGNGEDYANEDRIRRRPALQFEAEGSSDSVNDKGQGRYAREIR